MTYSNPVVVVISTRAVSLRLTFISTRIYPGVSYILLFQLRDGLSDIPGKYRMTQKCFNASSQQTINENSKSRNDRV